MMAITNLVLDNNWRFKESSATDWLPAQVPGCVHTDLIKNEQINDPFYGKNELDHQWIDKKDWEYKTNITVSEDRKRTRLNSSHVAKSYAVFCLQKKKRRCPYLRQRAVREHVRVPVRIP